MSIEDGLAWFDGESSEGRKEIMRSLDLCLFQSHPNHADILKGIETSRLKETYSPCVMLLKKPFNEARQKALKLSGLDQRRAFELFVSVFAIADERRREEQCKGGCTHEWHNLHKL